MTNVRGAVLHEVGGRWHTEELRLEEPHDFEVRVRVVASGFCHSEHHVVTGDQYNRLPMVGGHEGAGVVEAVGPGVTRVSPGDHIVTAYIPSCGRCRWCADGMQSICDNGADLGEGVMLDGTARFELPDGRELSAFCRLGTYANYLVTHETQCIKVSPDLPFEASALVACGVATGWGATVNGAGVRPRDVVLVVGVGGVGMNAVQGAVAAGAEHVVVAEPVEAKRQAALETFGATEAFASVAEARAFVESVTNGQGADSSVVTMGRADSKVIGEAFDAVRKRGTCVVVSAGQPERGIDISPFELIAMAKQLRGVLFGNCNPAVDIPRLLSYYQAGKLRLDELISKRYSVEEVNQAYDDMLAGRILRGVLVHEH